MTAPQGAPAGTESEEAHRPDARPRAVEADHPGWHVWQSSAGRWWAVKVGQFPDDEPEPVPMTVDADDEDGMRKLLGSYPRPEELGGGQGRQS